MVVLDADMDMFLATKERHWLEEFKIVPCGTLLSEPESRRSTGFGDGGLEFGADGFEDGCGVGELPGLLFGINFFAVDGDFEDAAAHRNERKRTDILLQPQQLFRQTDGLRFIISHAAVFDFDLKSHDDVNVQARENGVKWGRLPERSRMEPTHVGCYELRTAQKGSRSASHGTAIPRPGRWSCLGLK